MAPNLGIFEDFDSLGPKGALLVKNPPISLVSIETSLQFTAVATFLGI